MKLLNTSIFVQTFIPYNDDNKNDNNSNNNNNNNNSNSDNNDNDNSMFFIKYPLLITTLTIKIYLPLICFFFLKKLFSQSTNYNFD